MVFNFNFRSFVLIFNERDSVNDALKSYVGISYTFYVSLFFAFLLMQDRVKCRRMLADHNRTYAS
jgi:hypothetical protein